MFARDSAGKEQRSVTRFGAQLLCAVVLTVTRLYLRSVGLRQTVRMARKATAWREARTHSDSIAFGKAMALTVEKTATLFPGRALCLEQSITLFVMLRWAGVPATLRLGAQALPFTAHAWVDLCGEPINAARELLAVFQPFPDLPE